MVFEGFFFKDFFFEDFFYIYLQERRGMSALAFGRGITQLTTRHQFLLICRYEALSY